MKRSLTILLAGALAAVLGGHAITLDAAPAPTLDAPLYAGIVGKELTLRGVDLGQGPIPRSVRFEYDGSSTTLYAGDPAIASWTTTEVVLTVPPEVRSGELRVVVDGAGSAPASIEVFELMTYSLPPGNSGALDLPLAIDVDPSRRVWVIEESHTHLKWVTPATGAAPAASGRVEIPQPPGAGIFSRVVDGVTARSRVSSGGEDIDVAGDGSIWFTQGGGGYLTPGSLFNTSRIVQYIPSSGVFRCFPAPHDDVEVVGVLVDDENGVVYYSEGALDTGNAISAFRPYTVSGDCAWDPYSQPRPSVCAGVLADGCHDRIVLPTSLRSPAHFALGSDGAIWFTEFWGTAIGRFDPQSRQLAELPLPTPLVRAGSGLWAGSGPWELEFDSSGDLWISDYFDASVLRLRPSLMESEDCTQLDESGLNPCVEDVFVGSDGYDLRTLHTVVAGSDGNVWFSHDKEIGLISAAHDGAAAEVEIEAASGGIAGIVEDASTGSLWFAMFLDRSVGRLREALGDADGLDYAENCPEAYNPDQRNTDRDFVDLSQWNKPFNDHTWPASDVAGDACDMDADNDGLANDLEIAGCASASGPSDPLVRDSDADLVLDGPECVFGTDPLDAGSRPPRQVMNDPDRDQLSTLVETQLGTDPTRPDTDGDRVYDGVEYLSYGSDPTVRNSDGDGCADGYEAASVNPDTMVSSLDLLIVAVSFGPAGSAKYVREFDINRDGAITATDMALLAVVFGPCKPN